MWSTEYLLRKWDFPYPRDTCYLTFFSPSLMFYFVIITFSLSFLFSPLSFLFHSSVLSSSFFYFLPNDIGQYVSRGRGSGYFPNLYPLSQLLFTHGSKRQAQLFLPGYHPHRQFSLATGSVVDPNLFFSDPDPTLTLISVRIRIVYEKYIWTADHLNIAKNFLTSVHYCIRIV